MERASVVGMLVHGIFRGGLAATGAKSLRFQLGEWFSSSAQSDRKDRSLKDVCDEPIKTNLRFFAGLDPRKMYALDMTLYYCAGTATGFTVSPCLACALVGSFRWKSTT